MTALAQLTDQQKRMLHFIATYQRQYGYSPSVREIGQVMGLRSPSTVHQHLRAIERKGYITRQFGMRAISILVDPDGKTQICPSCHGSGRVALPTAQT